MKTMSIWVASATLFLASMGISSCSMSSTTTSEMKGNLEFTQEDLREKPFKAIDVDVLASVYYTQNDGDEFSVRLDYSAVNAADAEFAQKLKEKIKVVYRDGEVKIGLTGKVKVPAICNSEKNRLKIYITSPDLVKITQEGVGAFYAKSINSDRLEIDNEGVGSVSINKILANRLDVTNEGVGSVSIDHAKGDVMKIDNEGVGSVKVGDVAMGDLKVDNEGVGSVTLDFFKGGNLKINNEGVGKVSAKVDCQVLNVDLDGVGGVHLSGVTGKYTRHKDGVGSISDGKLKVGR